jgi:hypothetical protein
MQFLHQYRLLYSPLRRSKPAPLHRCKPTSATT